ncbi:MAG: SOS response-associated peptidase family protein, partial [Steroidobacteraceae bacterium]
MLPEQAAAEREFLPTRAWWSFTPRFNVAARQYVPAIRWHDGQSEAVMMRWGLIPSWAEGRAGQQPTTVDLDAILESN